RRNWLKGTDGDAFHALLRTQPAHDPAEATASFGLDRSQINAAIDPSGLDLAPTPARTLLIVDLFRPDCTTWQSASVTPAHWSLRLP
ncbi:hypothetical protein, partial [Chitinivorax sp. B]|uniref:hypothetical protein n=1 Tax=Chitinivorax sp. B TaxID=2502235 RepID=UPI001BB145E4